MLRRLLGASLALVCGLECAFAEVQMRAPASTSQQTARNPSQAAPPPVIPKTFGYALLDRVVQSRTHFVQGLQLVDDTLYVGTGMYGESRLLEYAFPNMQLRQEAKLPPNLFGEGITRYKTKIYQLTWRAGVVLVYDAESLELERQHRIETQGWGITHNGKELIYSDGSDRLYWLDPDTLQRRRTRKVTLRGQPLTRLNELEWIDGEIWANVWGANQLVRIDPATGVVTSIVDLRGLLPDSERDESTDVLNGIAWDAKERALWVTGKRWPWIYRIRVVAMPTSTDP